MKWQVCIYSVDVFLFLVFWWTGKHSSGVVLCICGSKSLLLGSACLPRAFIYLLFIYFAECSLFSFFLQESNPGNLTSVSTPNLLSAGVCLFFFLSPPPHTESIVSAWSVGAFRPSICPVLAPAFLDACPDVILQACCCVRVRNADVLLFINQPQWLIVVLSLLLFCRVCIHFLFYFIWCRFMLSCTTSYNM